MEIYVNNIIRNAGIVTMGDYLREVSVQKYRCSRNSFLPRILRFTAAEVWMALEPRKYVLRESRSFRQLLGLCPALMVLYPTTQTSSWCLNGAGANCALSYSLAAGRFTLYTNQLVYDYCTKVSSLSITSQSPRAKRIERERILTLSLLNIFYCFASTRKMKRTLVN